ncbi:DUF3010 domain-containing protein [Sphingobium sp. SCG-1]|uniref:DUF3010 family protein n=1 Tax=Sphingobium sp. SCG-1 TaxID=2072936 RepID=UPI000CD677F3|nr:DUF3010 family protein [Sphingobium sp. SCG-1]AUW58041.1 DUF3010 domain-containing protein [Sphingobium sp. SCG-1]
MKVCGVEIKAKEAILAIVEIDDEGGLLHIKSASKKLSLNDDRDCKSVQVLFEAIKALAKDHNLKCFVIKTRQTKGQMAAGGVTFKIEGLFQLSGIPVEFVSPQALSKLSSKNTGAIPATINQYQSDAYLAAVSELAKL